MKKRALDLKQSLLNLLGVAARYRVVIFVLGMAAVYGYVIFTISSLSSAQPSETTVTSEVTAIRIPKIDKSVVKELEDLRDNSVSVQTLFEQARDNPFNE